jgi:hypothetical protein
VWLAWAEDENGTQTGQLRLVQLHSTELAVQGLQRVDQAGGQKLAVRAFGQRTVGRAQGPVEGAEQEQLGPSTLQQRQLKTSEEMSILLL